MPIGHATDKIRIGHADSNGDDVNRCEEWRTETNHLLHDYSDKMDKMDDNVQADLIRTLSVFFKQSSTNLDNEELTTDLRGILRKLFEFCSITARAKAAYVSFVADDDDDDGAHTGHPHKTFQFKEHKMEFKAMMSREQGVADIVVSPGLAKYGNSDGENYDQREILDKMGVAI